MNTILIAGGRVIDPVQDIDAIKDIVVRGDFIMGLFEPGEAEKRFPAIDRKIDARGLLVFPGFIDMQVHLREPGNERLETIHTGARAAIAGGFATIAALPDTDPPVDTESAAEYVFLQAERAGYANVYPMGALTKERKGEFLAEIGQLFYANAVAFTDAPNLLGNASLMLKAMKYVAMFDRTLISHPEEPTLCANGVMNSSFNSAMLGLPTRPIAAEAIMIARDLRLAKEAKVKVHFAPITAAESIKLIKQAKAEGNYVTCSTAPHYLLLTDDLVKTYDASCAKVAPPLRTKEDNEALLAGIIDGTVDAIASDHTPCSYEDKALEFTKAPFGLVGLETTVALIYSEFVRTGAISLKRYAELFASNPAKILSLDGKGENTKKGTLIAGYDADITILDPDKKWRVNPDKFLSKSRNTAFAGTEITGKPRYVFVRGKYFDCENL